MKETTMNVDGLSMSNENQIRFAGKSLLITKLKVVRLEILFTLFASGSAILYWKYRVISEPIHFPTGTETPFPIIL